MASFSGGDLSKVLWREFLPHTGHDIECVFYANSKHFCDTCQGFDPMHCVFNDIVNVSIECVSCCVVLIDVENPDLGGDHEFAT